MVRIGDRIYVEEGWGVDVTVFKIEGCWHDVPNNVWYVDIIEDGIYNLNTKDFSSIQVGRSMQAIPLSNFNWKFYKPEPRFNRKLPTWF